MSIADFRMSSNGLAVSYSMFDIRHSSFPWPVIFLVLIVGTLLGMAQHPRGARLFRWLPVPLWCYAAPMILMSIGWLPQKHPAYAQVMTLVLPVALALLLLGLDVAAVMRVGGRALVATMIGTISIVVGAPLIAWVLRQALPTDAWKGVGALAATWTGGSMNLVSVRAILETPERIFTSLIVVDTLIAYAWMALLVALAARETAVNRWLRAKPFEPTPPSVSHHALPFACTIRARIVCLLIAAAVTWVAAFLALLMPLGPLVSSVNGWIVLLVTTITLGLSSAAGVRRLQQCASSMGYPWLYLVLAAMGAQASLKALWSAPVWLVLGIGIAVVHGLSMLIAGRLLRIPLGVLATASQANLGGVVSTPIVGAVYRLELAPIGLLLAVACNAVGTYLGIFSAALCRALLGDGT